MNYYNIIIVVLLLIYNVVFVIICPYNKVEESFNTQATHDIIYYRDNLSQYDHNEFPGVVPRTFIGPLFLSIVSFPVVIILIIFDWNTFLTQYLIRCILGTANIIALSYYTKSIESLLGSPTATWTLLITLCQFHYLFYCSRTLPNTFALLLFQIAIGGWIRGNHVQFIFTSSIAIIVFRSELAIILGLFLLYDIFTNRVKFIRVVILAICGATIALASTVFIDSYFWQTWLWPEGTVFWYNTMLNKSSKWGVSPFHWYFSSALPRMLLGALPLCLMGCFINRRLFILIFIPILFIIIYSLLPHKESRFIVYTIPLFNSVAGNTVAYITQSKKINILKIAFIIACLLSSFIISLFMLLISHYNYPGGVGLSKFHNTAIEYDKSEHISLHISVEAAQTGVSRFGQLNKSWVYAKIEDVESDTKIMDLYDWKLTTPAKYIKYFKNSHDLVESIEGYKKILFIKSKWLNIYYPKIEFNTKLVLIQKNITK